MSRISDKFEEDEETTQPIYHIIDGCPEDKIELHGLIRAYFKVRDELAMEEGPTFRRGQLVIG